MVRNAASRPSRALLAAAGAGACLAATAVAFSGTTAEAQTTSSAFGISASGIDNVGAQPSASSDAAVKSASAGTVRGASGSFTATGLAVKAGAGIAEARVQALSVGGRAIGSVTARCAQGKTSVSHSGDAIDEPFLKVSFGAGGGPSAVGATIRIVGADGQAVQTITVASVTCGTGSAPTNPPTSQPTSTPTTTSEPTATATQPPGQPDTAPDSSTGPKTPAPKPKPVRGHHPVTG